MFHKEAFKMSKEEAMHKSYKKIMIGNVMVILGALWGLKELGYIQFVFGATVDLLFWPLVLMFAGIFMMAKGIIIKKKFKL